MQPNRDARLIGSFVLGGFVLLIAGIVAFTSSGFFSRSMNFVMYFDSSLNGLEVGSPVSFRGVDIGRVTNIVMEFDAAKKEVNTPVYVEIDPERFKVSSFTDQLKLLAETPVASMVKKGLRAQLQTQSWITGQMYIELEFHPSFPARYRAEKDMKADEIPTIPSQFDQVQATLKNVLGSIQKLDLQKLVDTAVTTMETAQATVQEVHEITKKVNEKMDVILVNLDGASGEGHQRLVELKQTIKQLNQATAKVNKLAGNVDGEVRAISPALNKSATNAASAFDQMGLAMRALKELAELLERNPDALLTGKQRNGR